MKYLKVCLLGIILMGLLYVIPSYSQTSYLVSKPDVIRAQEMISIAQDNITREEYTDAALALMAAADALDPTMMKSMSPMMDQMYMHMTGTAIGDTDTQVMDDENTGNAESSDPMMDHMNQMSDQDRHMLGMMGLDSMVCPTLTEEDEAQCLIDWLAGTADYDTSSIEDMMSNARIMRRSGKFMNADRTMIDVQDQCWTVAENMDFEFGCDYGMGFMMQVNRARDRAMSLQDDQMDLAVVYETLGMAETAWSSGERAKAWRQLGTANDSLILLGGEYRWDATSDVGSAWSP